MATLLVIGGSGFFGKSILSAYVRGLLDPWCITHINLIARSATKLNEQNPELLNSTVSLFDLDITRCHDLPSGDIIIHAAASADPAQYVLAPTVEQDNITRGASHFCNLLDSAHRQSKILYVSSGAVYGQVTANSLNITENFAPSPIIDEEKLYYACGKRTAESAILQRGLQGGKVSIARCFAFVGAHLPLQKHFAIGNFIADGLKGQPIKVNAPHLVYRSYMHADDLVVWLMTIAANSNTGCPTYNVGSPHAIELRDLALKVARFFNLPTIIPNLSSDKIDWYVPCTNRATEALNLRLTIPLEQAIESTITAIMSL